MVVKVVEIVVIVVEIVKVHIIIKVGAVVVLVVAATSKSLQRRQQFLRASPTPPGFTLSLVPHSRIHFIRKAMKKLQKRNKYWKGCDGGKLHLYIMEKEEEQARHWTTCVFNGGGCEGYRDVRGDKGGE